MSKVHTVTLSSGDDYYSTNSPQDLTINAGNGNDQIFVTSAATDVLNGGNGDDWMGVAGPGTFTLNGGNGNDGLTNFGSGNVTENGGKGYDYLYSSNGHALMDGGDDNDTLFVSGGNAVMKGGAGDDTFAFGDDGNGFHAIVKDAVVGHDHLDFGSFGYYDWNTGDYYPPSIDQFSVHGNSLYVNADGHVDVIDGVGHTIMALGGVQGAIDAGFMDLGGGGKG